MTLNKNQKEYVREIKQGMKHKEFNSLDIVTVNKLVGLEIDILVIYLSWPSDKSVEEMHQLLKTAFSRPRYGLFIFGNS